MSCFASMRCLFTHRGGENRPATVPSRHSGVGFRSWEASLGLPDRFPASEASLVRVSTAPGLPSGWPAGSKSARMWL